MLTKLKFRSCSSAIILKIILFSFAFIFIASQLLAQELSINYRDNYPRGYQDLWTYNFQGISNNENFWFFTQRDVLWKITSRHDLKTPVSEFYIPGGGPIAGSNETDTYLYKTIDDYNELKNNGYNNFGDPDNFEGFMFVPVRGNNKNPVIAAFKEDNLAFVDYYEIKNIEAEWCAINPITKELYTSDANINSSQPISVYQINWDKLKNSNDLELNETDSYSLSKSVPYTQGGDFSQDGCYLFISNGYWTQFDSNDVPRGIFVFKNIENEDGKFEMTSTHDGVFAFAYDTDNSSAQEPQGLTYGTPSSTPNLGGQLHVSLYETGKDWCLLCENPDPKLWIKHYDVNYEFCEACQTVAITGCTDNKACNYNPDVNCVDNDSCELKEGCMNERADNYDEDVCWDDGSCIYKRAPIFYPNPATDTINVILNTDMVGADIFIRGLRGIQMDVIIIEGEDENIFALDISSYPKGTYAFIAIKGEREVIGQFKKV